MPQFNKGQKIGDYEILEPDFGAGASGPVCLAKDAKGRKCVIKFLFRSEEDAHSRLFKAEYRYLAELKHPNIAAALDFGFYDRLFYLVTEFVEGRNLFECCYDKSPSDALPLFLEALEALDFIHKSGFLHLDIKPENIIVDEKTSHVKVIDLGTAARAASFRNLGQGTVPYIAPEIVLGMDCSVDARADLFSFGATMYYCLTRGELPFLQRNAAIEKGAVNYERLKEIVKAEPIPQAPSLLRRGIPEFANRIILRLLASSPADRFYLNARAVINAVQTTREGNFGTMKSAASYLRPMGNVHIGRQDLKKQLNNSLCSLYKGIQPDMALFYIRGEYGMGKTHLLGKIKEEALQHAREVYLSEIAFPMEAAELERQQIDLQRVASENRRSALILIDDAHEAGELKNNLQNIIKSLTERTANLELYKNTKPIMIVMAGEERNNAPSPLILSPSKDEHFSIYELKPFTKDELRAYLELTPAFHGQKISQKWLDNLYWSSSGIPMEVAAKLEEKDLRGGLFTNLDGKIVAFPSDESSIHMTVWHGVPQTARDRLLRQYNKLAGREKELLNFIAAWGHKGVARPPTEEDVRAFFRSSIGQVINNLVERGILAHAITAASVIASANGAKQSPASSRQLSFANPFMPAVVYEQMPQSDREGIHDSIAAYLKNDPEGALFHKGFGKDRTGGAKSLVMLARRRANERGELRLATELLNSALEMAKAPPLRFYGLCLLVEYHVNRGKYAEAKEVFGRAMQEMKTAAGSRHGRVWLGQLFRRIMPAFIVQHEFEKADEVALEFKKLAIHPNTPTALIMKNWEGRKLYERHLSGTKDAGDLKKAMELFKAAEQEEKSMPEANRSRIYNNELGNVLLAVGDYAGAVVKLKEKLARNERERNFVGVISVSYAIASALKLLKKYDEAAASAMRALDLSKKVGGGKWLLTGHFILSNIHHDAGRFADAIGQGDRCFAIGGTLGDATEWKDVRGRLMLHMGDSYLETKEYGRAILHFEAAIKCNISDEYKTLASKGIAECHSKLGRRPQPADQDGGQPSKTKN